MWQLDEGKESVPLPIENVYLETLENNKEQSKELDEV